MFKINRNLKKLNLSGMWRIRMNLVMNVFIGNKFNELDVVQLIEAFEVNIDFLLFRYLCCSNQKAICLQSFDYRKTKNCVNWI
jgi:hypothetical protein